MPQVHLFIIPKQVQQTKQRLIILKRIGPSHLGKPSFKKSAVFFNIVQKGGAGGQTHVQKLCCEFCIIQRALWQHKLRHRKDV